MPIAERTGSMAVAVQCIIHTVRGEQGRGTWYIVDIFSVHECVSGAVDVHFHVLENFVKKMWIAKMKPKSKSTLALSANCYQAE